MRSPVFMERTRAAYHLHHRQAKQHGQHLDYDMEAFRQHVEEFLARASCCYCNGRIDANNFSSDHMQPVSRGGSFSLNNGAPLHAHAKPRAWHPVPRLQADSDRRKRKKVGIHFFWAEP